ncbi:MAG: bifunctional phosphoribosylaminoimidazolecarboxamide formyltransferase/IMP cyclohydrolase [Filomicrobium sp.]
MAEKPRKITRALISVSDKTNLVPFAKALAGFGVELVSTGGTARALKDAGLPVRDVSALTGMPEMMDGRVKTLHPKVHGGLLYVRDNAEHQAAADEHGILAIDMLVVSLYPFEETLAAGGDFDALIENIDIGGPAMIRAAAKNHDGVTVIVDAADYDCVLEELKSNDGATVLSTRRALAAKAYSRTASYDAAISNWMLNVAGEAAPTWRTFGGRLAQVTRYGENPHQRAAFYKFGEAREGVATAVQHQGKELSYNNLNDTDAAFELVSEFDEEAEAAVAIIKHANPCGVAAGASLAEAYARALVCDPVSAFGGIIACNREIDEEAAREMTKIFTEVVIAPGATDAAKAVFAEKKNLRLLTTPGLPEPRSMGLIVKAVSGGLLVQDRDNACVDDMELKVVTKRAPTETELENLKFAFKVAKHVKSNAIVYAKDRATVGIGAGQMSRVDSTRIAAWKSLDAAKAAGEAEALTKGSVVASDAFFPFADGLITAAEAGATAVIQPGGSMRDDEVIKAADERDLAMVFTAHRHFRH